MTLAALVFFIAIFGGALFLLALIWFIFKRRGNSGSSNRNFSSGNYNPHYRNSSDYDNDSNLGYVGGAMLASQETEDLPTAPTQNDWQTVENLYSQESYDASASSFDSGSSSSDSGSSSSSSD